MARNLIDLIDEDDTELESFKKLARPKKHSINRNAAREKIQQRRREKEKMKQEAEKEIL